MSTVQKAFVLIVLVLAVLNAGAGVVLFAQRDDWKTKSDGLQEEVKKTKTELSKTRSDLAAAKSNAATREQMLETELGNTKVTLEDKVRELDRVASEKSSLVNLVTQTGVSVNAMKEDIETLTTRTEELQIAKEAAEQLLAEVEGAAQDAKEQYAIANRKAEDLQQQVIALEAQVKERDMEVASLRSKISASSLYAPVVETVAEMSDEDRVHGTVTSIAGDGETIYISVGSDDGIEKGVRLIVYTAQGDYAAHAVVRKVKADQAAARVIKPVRVSISEGDRVATTN